MKDKDMYYNRELTDSFSNLIEEGGNLRWLFDFVKRQESLDFLIGKNKYKEWISVYRGLSRLITISNTNMSGVIKIDGAEAYKKIIPELYGKKSVLEIFERTLNDLLVKVESDSNFSRYYSNKKEGFYQNEFSRRFGIMGTDNAEFAIIDKETVIGYNKIENKQKLFMPLQKKYKDLQTEISTFDSKRFGKDLAKKSIGNEVDFIAVNKNGNILLIEYKHGTNTSGIYLSPLQIGLYYDIFTNYPKDLLYASITNQLKQKQKIGLINPNWKIPTELKDIIPVLVISEYSDKSSAKKKYAEILDFCKKKHGKDFLANIQTYSYTKAAGLTKW